METEKTGGALLVALLDGTHRHRRGHVCRPRDPRPPVRPPCPTPTRLRCEPKLLSLSPSTRAWRGQRDEVFVTASQHTVRTPASSCLKAQGQAWREIERRSPPSPGWGLLLLALRLSHSFIAISESPIISSKTHVDPSQKSLQSLTNTLKSSLIKSCAHCNLKNWSWKVCLPGQRCPLGLDCQIKLGTSSSVEVMAKQRCLRLGMLWDVRT